MNVLKKFPAMIAQLIWKNKMQDFKCIDIEELNNENNNSFSFDVKIKGVKVNKINLKP